MGMGDDWTFLTNHARVLLAVAADPDRKIRDLADDLGVTDRTAVSILGDLERAGYLRRERVGRRNHYTLDPGRPLRHPLEAHHQVGRLLEAIEHSSPLR